MGFAESVMHKEFGHNATLDGVEIEAIIDHAYEVVDDETGASFMMKVVHINSHLEGSIKRNKSILIAQGVEYVIGRLISNDGRMMAVEINAN